MDNGSQHGDLSTVSISIVVPVVPLRAARCYRVLFFRVDNARDQRAEQLRTNFNLQVRRARFFFFVFFINNKTANDSQRHNNTCSIGRYQLKQTEATSQKKWKNLRNRFRTELRWRRRMARRTTDVDWHSFLLFSSLFAALVVFIWIRIEENKWITTPVECTYDADDAAMDKQDTPFRLQFHHFFFLLPLQSGALSIWNQFQWQDPFDRYTFWI